MDIDHLQMIFNISRMIEMGRNSSKRQTLLNRRGNMKETETVEDVLGKKMNTTIIEMMVKKTLKHYLLKPILKAL
jgi:hypothetical protein